jgi:hypothetical protein
MLPLLSSSSLRRPRVTKPHSPGRFAPCYPLIARRDQAVLLAQSNRYSAAESRRSRDPSFDHRFSRNQTERERRTRDQAYALPSCAYSQLDPRRAAALRAVCCGKVTPKSASSCRAKGDPRRGRPARPQGSGSKPDGRNSKLGGRKSKPVGRKSKPGGRKSKPGGRKSKYLSFR